MKRKEKKGKQRKKRQSQGPDSLAPPRAEEFDLHNPVPLDFEAQHYRKQGYSTALEEPSWIWNGHNIPARWSE